MSKIIWTITDEAPALATQSLLPIVNAFTHVAGVEIESRDISLAGRVIATFPEHLTSEQMIRNDLQYLGNVVKEPEGNIIKLPNISASIPQLKECILELQNNGYNVPNYPENPVNDLEVAINEKYSTCLGSAVNPVLREGNSDRRAALAVKNYAKMNPHKLKSFPKASKTHVAHMNHNDFFGNEQSTIKKSDGKILIELHLPDGSISILNEKFVQDKEVIDTTYMSVKELNNFYSQEITDAKQNGLLFSLHLKATMMKVSDPILFGHCVNEFYKEVFDKYDNVFKKLDVNPNLGLSDLYKKLDSLPAELKSEIEQAIQDVYSKRPNLAMVNSEKGITNLHAPNDIIIDASMPVVVRDGGQMWNPDGELQECKAIIPDRSYATMYKEIIEDCIANGQFDVTTMGNVSNVGLMAQKAEEYGSHPTTFEIPDNGTVKVVDQNGVVLTSHIVEKGDIWRMSTAKVIPIKNWVKLAYDRAKITGLPVVFWLDEDRKHDVNIIKYVLKYLPIFNQNDDIEFHIMAPQKAMRFTLNRVRAGLDTISATGNVLRDYLTDLFPILELGTSAKMLSIVPLIAGGGLFETGAGGSAPKHVAQFLKEGHLRWDSLGEFLALAESLRFIAQKNDTNPLRIITAALDVANSKYLDNRKSPSRIVGESGNTSGHYYLAQYWARAIASQKEDLAIADQFSGIADSLENNEAIIIKELLSSEGTPQDIGGYYYPDLAKTSEAMRPSLTLNAIIDAI
ncbi:MAG: NADP-dependent isocitrate dehydrogenase [Candidatus Marinimicrobia bacterium]|nr:NADP-dependent isocitrate dehydrogenase [Candidatus Neomarinimicrobiota bacterium]